MTIKPLFPGLLGVAVLLAGCNGDGSMATKDTSMAQGYQVQSQAPAAADQQGGIPQLNYSCPGDIELHADRGGPIYINGSEAETKKFNDDYYEASKGDVTVSIALSIDGSANVSYTGPGRANGVCQPADGAPQAGGIPLLNYQCPGDLSVHVAKGGPIFINGNETEMTRFSDSYYEGKRDGVTISLTLMPDGSASVSYTAPGGANGICQPS